MHLHQPHRHVDEVRFIRIIRHSIENLAQLGVLIGDEPNPFDINIVERLGVLKLCAGSFGTDWRGVVVLGIEGRIEIDEVDALVINSAQYL